MTRFIHTADWQLGMTRHFLSPEARGRFAQDRIDAIRHIGEIARVQAAQFVVVCGDVFESNQVERQPVVRALDAIETISVPVYLLPGNHDPLDALGNSDPDRLQSMGAMLSQEGRECQIIILTCTPERFRHVGGAHVLRIARQSAVPSATEERVDS